MTLRMAEEEAPAVEAVIPRAALPPRIGVGATSSRPMTDEQRAKRAAYNKAYYWQRKNAARLARQNGGGA